MTEKPIKILIVEDNDFDFELVERKLKSLYFHCILKRVFIEEEFRNLLEKFNPNLILSDFSLPSFSGLEALKIAKKYAPLVPFIFVSGTIGEEVAVDALIQGANDYVLKDNLNKLEPAIKRVLNEAKEKEKRKEAEWKLQVKVDELKTLIYRISHDIRGPICSIRGAVNLIEQVRVKSQEEVAEYVRMIAQVTSKMEGIVLNLSSFQFIYADEVKAELINLEDFSAKLKKSVSEIEDADKVDFQLVCTGIKNYYSGEYNLLFSIFFNLIHNGIIFMDKSKPIKKVVCSIEVLENGIHLMVEDNGIGIPLEIQNKIFGMFYRGSSLSKGAGLGLYITKTILEKINGVIKLESQESVGTKWEITIPPLPLVVNP